MTLIPWLSILIFFPAIGAAVAALAGKDANTVRRFSLVFAVAELALALGLLASESFAGSGYKHTEFAAWVPALGANYILGVDGLSMWLVVLVAILTPVALVAGPNRGESKAAPALMLLLSGMMIGAFCSRDLLLFFTFFELTLLPMYFLISAGGSERSQRAAGKFLIYTFAGSIFMFVAMVGLALRYQSIYMVPTFSVDKLGAAVEYGMWKDAGSLGTWLFWAFALAFLVKMPVFPFHTWIPDSYGEARPSVPILSSAMVKLGSFGLLRFCIPLFPEPFRNATPILAGLAVAGIVYGAIVAAVQTDMRRMLAYSTLSHMGFVLLGIVALNPAGLNGAGFGQLAHGVTAAALLLLVGHLASERGSYAFTDYGGLKAKTPVLAFLFLIALMGSVGLPGTIGFVGEFLALMGGFQSGWTGGPVPLAAAALAGAGVVFAAVYLLTMFMRIFTGPAPLHTEEMAEVSEPRGVVLTAAVVLAILTILGGIMPTVVTKSMSPALETIQKVGSPPTATVAAATEGQL